MKSGEDNTLLKLTIFENAESSYQREYSTEDEITVGRSEHCALILRSKRVSREHCRIVFQDDHWHIEDLKSQNGIKVNGEKIPSGKLVDGDTIEIADYRIEVSWRPLKEEDSAAGPDDEDRTAVFQHEEEDRTVIHQAMPAAETGPDGIAGSVKKFLMEHKVLSGVAGTVLLFFLVIALFTGSGKDETRQVVVADEEREAVYDMETRHRIDAYLRSGEDQMAGGNFNEAIVRFQAILQLDPQHTMAREKLDEARRQMVQAEEARRRALEEERQRMDRVRVIQSRAREAYERKDFTGAREIIAEAAFLEPDDPGVLRLQSDIETAIQTVTLTRKQEEEERGRRMEALKRHFDQGQRYYEQDNYRAALREWEKVLETGIESPESAHVQHAIPQIRRLLEEDIRADYEKGLKYYQDKDYTRALVHLEKVASLSPDYKDTGRMLNEVFVQVESRARRLYQEGLVYEGLGQQSKAAERWREVLSVMPLEDNVYYQRASARLR